MSDTVCTWTKEQVPDGDVYYETSCGTAHEFMAGSPQDNHHNYCPYCGKQLSAGKASTSIGIEEELARR